jgi:Na+-translocating ferredoxin:NAD+ oxidoreductase subunit B
MSEQIAPDLVARVDALLPQTQCTRCGYTGCRPYAAAIADGQAEINQCPPGGAATIQALAELLQRPALALNPQNGIEGPVKAAWIDESRCIGCARCLAPCPVDAIVGAQKFVHTVIAERCTGCELCLPPCPVDCIVMKPHPEPQAIEPGLNRQRYNDHVLRLAQETAQRQRELQAKKQLATRRPAP